MIFQNGKNSARFCFCAKFVCCEQIKLKKCVLNNALVQPVLVLIGFKQELAGNHKDGALNKQCTLLIQACVCCAWDNRCYHIMYLFISRENWCQDKIYLRRCSCLFLLFWLLLLLLSLLFLRIITLLLKDHFTRLQST